MNTTNIKGITQVALIAVSILISNAFAGDIYKWVDADGKAHFSDSKPNSDPSKPVELKINSVSRADYSTSGATNGDQVIMYSTSWCGYCKKARAYFRENNISFTDYDIEEDRFAKIKYDRLGGRGVPLILVGGKQMSGFSVGAFQQLTK